MDPKNTFATPTTFAIYRAEWMVILTAAIIMFAVNITDVRWWVALIFFFYTDLIGYLPGAVAFRRSKDGRIPKIYYQLYNGMHSIVTAVAFAGLWALAFGWEWAMLTSVIHIAGDRGFFGNWLKPYSTSFEPHDPHPAWARVKDEVARPVPGMPGASDVEVGRAPQQQPAPQVGSVA